jgi:hypothetical protein
MSLIDDVLPLIFNHIDVKIIRLINHYWNNLMFCRYCEQLKKITNQDVFNYMKNNTILVQNTNLHLHLHTSLNCLNISVYHNILHMFKQQLKIFINYSLDYFSLFNIYRQRTTDLKMLNYYKNKILLCLKQQYYWIYGQYNDRFYLWLLLNKLLLTNRSIEDSIYDEMELTFSLDDIKLLYHEVEQLIKDL